MADAARARLGYLRAPAGRRQRAAFPRLGAGFAPQCGDEQPGAARGLQRQPAHAHRLLRRPVAEPGLVRQIQGAQGLPGIRCADRARRRKSSTTNCAISCSAAPIWPEDKKARFKAIQEELSTLSAKFEENLLDTTNAFALFVENEAELAGHSRRCACRWRAKRRRRTARRAGNSPCTCRPTCR